MTPKELQDCWFLLLYPYLLNPTMYQYTSNIKSGPYLRPIKDNLFKLVRQRQGQHVIKFRDNYTHNKVNAVNFPSCIRNSPAKSHYGCKSVFPYQALLKCPRASKTICFQGNRNIQCLKFGFIG